MSAVVDQAMLDAETVRRWLRSAASSIREAREYLTQLDAAIGDADHGSNMDRGFAAVVERLESTEYDGSPGRILVAAGGTLVSTVGGASGALWGTALRRAGHSLGDASRFDGAQLATALDEALAAVVELGAAQEGDKTMVDALAPATRTFRARIEAGVSLAEALTATCEAGSAGMQATVALQAAKGRASYLGDRSIGHQDPGATSTVVILEALDRAVRVEP